MEGRMDMANRVQERDDDEEISLKPYFDILRSYWRVIGASLVGVATLFAVGVILMVLLLPVERVGFIQFRLLFDGAAEGKYPNLTPFSVSEIVASPVLSDVYKVNDLQRFGRYEDFKDSVFIQQSNPDLDLLSYEYQALLADTKLSPVDRVRIQDEFKKKRAAIVDPSYAISMRRSERLKTMPPDLMEKVLMDTLKTWAQQADERKGATKYNVSVLSANVLQQDVLEREDYLVAIDILRSKANRVLDSLTEIAKLPGARAIRVGEERVTLADVRTSLEEVVRFRLEPLLGLIRSEGVTKSSRGLALYAGNQLFQLRLEQQESADVVQALQIALRESTAQRGPAFGESKAGAPTPGGSASGGQAVVPQVDQSFLDRIMTLSTAEKDAEYRRKLTDRLIEESVKMAARNREAAYYEDLVKELRTTAARSVGSADVVALIKTRSLEAFREIAKGVEQTLALYRELSAQNLNPSTTLFTVSAPFSTETQRSFKLKTLSLYFVLVMMLTLIVVPLGCLLHHSRRKPL